MRSAATALLALSALASLTHSAEAGEIVDPNLPQLRIVLFTPRDVSPPPGVETRLTQVARYAETFFVKWMTHWGYEPARRQIVHRQPDGSVEVLFAKGELNADQYTDGSFRPKMIQGLVREHRIPQNGNVWWIFVYTGDSKFPTFRGAGNSKQGGWAILNYVAAEGDIRLDADMAAGFHHDFTLKGAIHELGHALGLPHIGPRLKQDLGNSLMGPVTRIWEKHAGSHDRRVYLTEAEAAMLWKHPIFSGTSRDRGTMPKPELQGYRAQYDRSKNQIEVRGRLVSDRAAHSVVLVDDMDTKPGEYWVRGYVGRVDAKGEFDVLVDEPVNCGGTYRIVFCFGNGIVTGDGNRHGLPGAIEKKYRYVRGAYRFD